MNHTVMFEKNTRTGAWRAHCIGCYWAWVGFEDDVKQRAATHDLEWIAVEAKDMSHGPDRRN